MVSAKLLFPPYEGSGVDSAIIEESADGLTGWSLIETLNGAKIRTHPNFITQFDTANATALNYYFRVGWRIGGTVQEYTLPWQPGTLLAKWIAPAQAQ